MPSPKPRDLDLTRQQLRDWLRAKPDCAPDVEVGEITGPGSTGFSSDTLIFDATWTNHGGPHRERLVARVKPSGMTVFPHYDMGMQFRVMEILGHTDVPVPRVRWLDEDARVLGVPFYVMDCVEGRVPTDNPPYHAGGWVPELTPEEREAVWWSGFEAMARVHRLDWRGLGFDFVDRRRVGETPLQQQLREYDEYLEWGVDRTRYPLIERAQRWLSAHRPADEPVALCWGDARLGNQLFNGMACVAVLDWEMVRLGDPVQDLAWWVALDRSLSEGIGLARLPGFPDRGATIARWEQIVRRPARHVAYYELLAYYKFAIIMARISLQLKYYEIMPPENDMDVNNLASVMLARTLDEIGA